MLHKFGIKNQNGLKMKFFIFFKKFDHITVMCLKSNGVNAFKGKIISYANSTSIKIFVLTLIPSMLLAYKTLREKAWGLQLYLKRYSGTGVFLWILWNFYEHVVSLLYCAVRLAQTWLTLYWIPKELLNCQVSLVLLMTDKKEGSRHLKQWRGGVNAVDLVLSVNHIIWFLDQPYLQKWSMEIVVFLHTRRN